MSEELEQALSAALSGNPGTPPAEEPMPTQEQPVEEPVQEPAEELTTSLDFDEQGNITVNQYPSESESMEDYEIVDENSVNAGEEYQTDDNVIEIDEEHILGFLSERLGYQVNSFEDLSGGSYNEQYIDERVAAINDFVRETGRSPEDWYRYQATDPSEMDDMSLVRQNMLMEHSNLSAQEVDLLLSSKYKLDEDSFDEREVQLAKLQLKMDADSARTAINNVREQYAAPIVDDGGAEFESPITEEWVSNMAQTVEDLDGLEFDLPSGDVFTFGLDNQYKQELVMKNANLEEFFEDYVYDDGSWDYDKLNTHRALIDNIGDIAASIYQQGLSDGQRKVVQSAANVQNVSQPAVDQTVASNSDGIAEQLAKALGGPSTLTFKI